MPTLTRTGIAACGVILALAVLCCLNAGARLCGGGDSRAVLALGQRAWGEDGDPNPPPAESKRERPAKPKKDEPTPDPKNDPAPPKTDTPATPKKDEPASPKKDEPAQPKQDQPQKDKSEKESGQDAKDQAQPGPDQPTPDQPVPQPPPEGVKRKRPQTADEERAYKLRKTREDPFLNPPTGSGAAGDLTHFYNPHNYIAPLTKGYSAKYMIQDAGGNAVGYLQLAVDLTSVLAHDDTVLINAAYSNEPRTQMRLWLDARTLAPQRLERRVLRGEDVEEPPDAGAASPSPKPEAEAPGDTPPAPPASDPDAWSPDQEPPRLNAEYVFDRVTIRHSSGVITVERAIRQLPASFELESMPVLVRQIDCRSADWPFEAALTDARHFRSLPLSIAEPGWVEVLSAEPLQYRCREFVLHLGGQQLAYDVQSTPPYKLVRFNDGVYSYTLFDYASH